MEGRPFCEFPEIDLTNQINFCGKNNAYYSLHIVRTGPNQLGAV